MVGRAAEEIATHRGGVITALPSYLEVEIMTLNESVYRLSELACGMEIDVYRLGRMPDDYKPRLQQIRRICNKLLIGEYEVEGTDDADD